MSFAPGGAAQGPANDRAVPDVRGYAPALARRKLQAAGFGVTIAAVPDARGAVAEQRPEAGALALAGTTVRLIIR
jgi:beta-lactam-binding protein with PASTA domain